jgi:hypothetical protein
MTLAIRKGIEAGAILWKESETVQRQHWNPETREYEMRDYTYYYVFRLTTRRARTQGHSVNRKLYPFFESLRIKLIEQRSYYNDGEQYYIAVGTERFPVRNKEEWEAMEVDEAAAKWYNKLTNENLQTLLDKRDGTFSDEILDEMKEAMADDDTDVEEWPREPNLPEYPMQISSYARTINW